MANPRPHVQSVVTCSVSASGSGPVKLFNGKVLQVHLRALNVTMTFTGVGGRYQSGAKKGECEQENDAPLAMLASVIGRGSVLAIV